MNPKILDTGRATAWLLLGLLLFSCTEQGSEGLLLPALDERERTVATLFPANPSPQYLYPQPVPKDRLAVGSFSAPLRMHIEEKPAYLLRPTEIFLSGAAGQTLRERNVGVLPGLPPQADILFCFDLTGSMAEELFLAKLNALDIMKDLSGVIPDSRFGLISHMDYPGRFAGCGYDESYGSAAGGDYPFRLEAPLGGDLPAVAAAVDGLHLGGGRDFPENYSRVFHEASNNPDVGWRPGAKRMVVAWLDAIPHDCDVDGIWGGNLSTGPDPGPDGEAGTGDDLSILEVLEEMSSRNITLLVLYSGVEENPYVSRSLLELWDDFAKVTGGRAFRINPDGTVPGKTPMAEFLTEAVRREAGRIGKLSLEVCSPDYGDWVSEVSPRYYSFNNLQLYESFPFELTVSIPEGTPSGKYDFEVCMVGDGVAYASQTIHVTVD